MSVSTVILERRTAVLKNGAHRVLTIGLIGLLLAGAGCRREEPGASSKPGADVSGTAAPTTAEARGGASFSSASMRGVDEEDDLEAPRALPRTIDLQQWIKTEPVRVAPAAELARLVDDEKQRAILAAFRLERIARCTYSMGDTTARVLYVEAAAPEDAFGVFSLLTSQPPQPLSADNSIRATEVTVDRRILSAWQGQVCVRVTFRNVHGPQTQAECEKLFDRIVFTVPAADPPLLMRLVPREKQEGVRFWQARAAAALRYADNDTLRILDAATIDDRLGLTSETLLSVAAVPVPGESRPNVIWLVQYPDAESARAASERYHTAVETSASSFDANTHPGSAKGRFFIGSWSADQESLQGLLPLLESALPG